MHARIATIAYLILILPAAAASFDCNKASTPLEYAICGDPELSRADENMADAFAAMRKMLSGDASARVLESQRNWHDYAERVCTDDAMPMTGGRYDADGIACLTNVFTQRADQLKASGPVGGVLFYSVEMFKVVPDPYQESWVKVATTEVSFPQIDDAGAEARAFNAYAYSLAASAIDPVEGEDDGTSDYALTIKVQSVRPNLISLVQDEYFYGHGAAHPNSARSYGHVLRSEGRPLLPRDVFAGGDWVGELKPLIIDRLKADILAETGVTDAIWEDLDGFEDLITDPTRWRIEEDGIAFQFQPYEVAPYAYGAPKALLNWHELRPWLQPGAEALLTGH